MLGLRKLFNLLSISGPNNLTHQTRNTFILKRRKPPPLHKKGGKPHKLRGRHFVYDLVEDTNVTKKADLQIILNQYVEGVGEAGQLLTLRPSQAYRDFLLPGLAIYASPENLNKYKVDESKPKEEKLFSSPYVPRTMGCLSRLVLQITMNKDEPWTLQPVHVKAFFRQAGFIVPEYAIIMPPVEIKGPDLSLHEKEFFVTIKINNTEQVNVRCRIHHWNGIVENVANDECHWKIPREALIPEQAPILAQMPLRE